jgi:hypothetical protein
MSGTAETLAVDIDDLSDMVRVDECPWSLAPQSTDRPVVGDPLDQSKSELIERVASLEADVATHADLAKQALHQLVEKKVAAHRDQARIHDLRGELQLAHNQVRVLGAQLRALQEAP